MVLTSRPANTLSDRSNRRIVTVLRRLHSHKRAIVVIARSPRITTRTRQIVRVHSNRVIHGPPTVRGIGITNKARPIIGAISN